MERNKLAPPIVVIVSRGELVVCGTGIAGLLKLPFPPHILKDLNVADLPTLSAQVKAFVESSHIKPSDLVMVLNEDIYFYKALGETMNVQMTQQVQDFIDSVPLSNPSSKVFKVDGKYYAVVINRHLYESVRAAFEACGFAVIAAVPELVLGQLGVAKGAKVDANACRLLLRKMDYIKVNSFVGPAHDVGETSIVNKNKGLALGLSIGSILLALGVTGVFWWQVNSSKQAAIARLKVRAAEKSSITPTPILVLATPASGIGTYRVLFQNVPATVSSQLQQIGLANISEEASSTGILGTVSFLPIIPISLREQIVNVLRNFRPDVQVLESNTGQFDITVTL